jgi:hypothetical protein
VCPLGWNIGFSENCLHRTLRNTGITVDTSFWIDVQHIVVEVKGLNGTNQRTVSVAAVHTWFCNDVSHSDAFSLKIECPGLLAFGTLWVKDRHILSMNPGLLKDESVSE